MLCIDVGFSVILLTCDGPSCHFSMLTELGASLQPLKLKPYFLHPLDPSRKIYILLDVCHMLKVVRNTLGEGGNIKQKCFLCACMPM